MFKSVLVTALAGSLLWLGSARASEILVDQTASGDLPIVAGSGIGVINGSFTGEDVNAFLGAQTLYDLGYTGSRTRVANIEAGFAWSGHETLGQVNQMVIQSGAAGEFDRHATATTGLLAGRPTAPGNTYQRGMAYDAETWSGSMATGWTGSAYSLSFQTNSTVVARTYQDAIATGLSGVNGSATADVINNSYGLSGDTSGTSVFSMTIDALVNQNPRTLVVFAAGNNGTTNSISGPAAGYNVLTVAALSHSSDYNAPASFSSYGPSDYQDPNGSTTSPARATVDIAAPGDWLGIAHYGGTTGGNSASLGGTGSSSANAYSLYGSGTSYAAPIVAGGAALLYDVAYDQFASNGDARDARVMKAVLMNSADKTSGWDNGQIAHPNSNGGVQTYQSLDYKVGAGRMNLAAAYGQFTGGTTDVAGTAQGVLGSVEETGWDYGVVTENVSNQYNISEQLRGGSTFTATLTWFRDRTIDAALTTVNDVSFDDLDLELWTTDETGALLLLIAESASRYNDAEHFSFALPTTSYYALRVIWFGDIFDTIDDVNEETYGLAWAGVAIPEPATGVMLTLLLLATPRRKRRNLSEHAA